MIHIAPQYFVSSTSLKLSSRMTIVQWMEKYSRIVFWKKTFLLELSANWSRFDRWFTIIESNFQITKLKARCCKYTLQNYPQNRRDCPSSGHKVWILETNDVYSWLQAGNPFGHLISPIICVKYAFPMILIRTKLVIWAKDFAYRTIHESRTRSSPWDWANKLSLIIKKNTIGDLSRGEKSPIKMAA
jgi:hypothetical protein